MNIEFNFKNFMTFLAAFSGLMTYIIVWIYAPMVAVAAMHGIMFVFTVLFHPNVMP